MVNEQGCLQTLKMKQEKAPMETPTTTTAICDTYKSSCPVALGLK